MRLKEPKTKGVAKTPIVMQLEVLECGAASLAMVMAYYNKWVALEQVRIDCGVSRDGSNAKNILKAANKYGFTTKGYAYNVKKLREKGKFPCIIHWNLAHFVVLNGFKGNTAIINDPARGLIKVPISEFEKSYSGIYLELIPNETFVPGGKRKSMIKFAKKRLVGAVGLVILFAITTVIFYAIGIANPQLRQFFVDNLLGGNQEKLIPFIAMASGLAIAEILVTLFETIYQYKIRAKLAKEGNASYMKKVLRLPIEFFSQRMSGDIQQRKNENANIAEVLVNVLAPLLFNSLMIVFYLVVMFNKSLVLTLIGIVTIILNIISANFISKKKINIARVQTRDSAKVYAMTSKGIEMIETIKASGAEESFFNTWSEAQEASSNQKYRLARIGQILGLLPGFISMFANFGVLIIGVLFTINGDFTVGGVMAFQILLSSLMSPTLQVINTGQTIQEMRTQMERIDDVMEYRTDENVDRKIDGEKEKLSGHVHLDNVTFGYSKVARAVIYKFSLDIKPGQMVAIVGETGSGKSTISKLISGLYKEWEGDILFDGMKIEEIDHKRFIESVAVVDQDIILFEDTVGNNVRMWNDNISKDDVIKALKDAQIYDLVMSYKNQLEERLIEGGKNLSGGERQRIEIARALAQNPKIIILDEATSALDAKTEYEVVEAIKKRGITCIIIAHRLSTIKDADCIVVLRDGNIVEKGDHKSLMALNGYYRDLIKNN